MLFSYILLLYGLIFDRFWAGPVVILVAMFAMPKWSREKTVNAVEQFVGLIGHLFFLVSVRRERKKQAK